MLPFLYPLLQAIFFPFAGEEIPQAKPLNVIWIIADDLGYYDLSIYGNKEIQTPHIDALGSSGVMFTKAYATAPICGPSREGMITGRYQQRFGGEYMPYEVIDPKYRRKLAKLYLLDKGKLPGLAMLRPHMKANPNNYQTGLSEKELTIGDVMKQHGYTTGLIGKWNEGAGDGYYPDQRGFDYNYSFSGALTRYVNDPVDSRRYASMRLPWSFSDIPAWAPRYGSSAITAGRQVVADTGYLTFSLAKKATEFIATNKERPFFLMLSFNAPHDPFQAPRDYLDRVPPDADSVRRIYNAMILALDDAVGNVMAQLKAAGLENNTLIFLISDNGAATYTRATDNAPLRGGKCTHFEGGLLVPFLMKMPGSGARGTTFNKPVSSLDMFATTVAAAGLSLPGDRPYDGVSLLPYVEQQNTAAPHPMLYWRNGYSKAIRQQNWKLYLNDYHKKVFLFDLDADPYEQENLAAKYPEKVAALKSALQHWETHETIAPKWPSAADIKMKDKGEWLYFPS
ncbi:sulfatase-like hydrolase/transferase [Chitinophaga sp. sic0106]|uniref:sulfatase-like hydrolase/transferase n=1 Tax=Chitinophaga sp. sic0106 TaxID=2854785 RepID=UPI001C442B12|nr:sulfatase-like hydrolase/transferase [Chitinophaga sp. sic0106]MBV7530128.1 sulfatase-like hydrolase/transferase [Chitinophaga sp. sic0106]